MAAGSDKMTGLRWRGLFGPLDRMSRIAGEVMLIILAISMILTQTAFFRVGDVHVLGILAPIVLSSFVFGPKRGTLCGFISGVALMLHAMFMPLDYYERYFALFTNSVVLLTLVGLLSGLVLSHIVERMRRGPARVAAYAGVAAAISLLATTVFHAGITVINNVAVKPEDLPEELIASIVSTTDTAAQVALGALVVFVALCILEFWGPRVLRPRSERSVRYTFKVWLALLVAVSFLMASGITFAVSTPLSLREAQDEMNGQISYIVRQLAERDSWFRLMQSGGADRGTAERIYAQSVTDVASDMQLWGSGVILVADNDQIVSANQPGYEGKSLTDILEAGLLTRTPEDVFGTDELLEYYMGNSADIAYVCGRRSSYMRSSEYGSYQVVIALDSSEVFYNRTTLMVVIQGVCLMIFLFIYIRTARLLDSLVVKALKRANDTLGLITDGDLDQRVSVETSSEFASLSHGVNTMVDALKASIEEAASRYDRELAAAAAIQDSALPSTFPPFPQIDRFDLYASMNPAKEVGGDFYDFFLIGEDKLGFVIADVSDKGIPAALFMMTSKTHLANYLGSGMPLAQAVQTANYHLCESNDANMFVTAWIGVLDYKTGHLSYVNAGHNHPLLRHDGKLSWITERSGLILGSYDMPYTCFEMDLEPGDMLFLYTDGVTEATNAADELYGDDRLEALLARDTHMRPRACVRAVAADVAAFQRGVEQADDVTMLAIAYGIPPEAAASAEFAAKRSSAGEARGFVDDELSRRLCPLDVKERVDHVFDDVFSQAISLAPQSSRVTVSYAFTTDPDALTIEVACPGEELDLIAAAHEGEMSFAQEDVDDLASVHEDGVNMFVFRVSW